MSLQPGMSQIPQKLRKLMFIGTCTGMVSATGNFVLTYGKRRMLADSGTYNVESKAIHVRNLREPHGRS